MKAGRDEAGGLEEVKGMGVVFGCLGLGAIRAEKALRFRGLEAFEWSSFCAPTCLSVGLIEGCSFFCPFVSTLRVGAKNIDPFDSFGSREASPSLEELCCVSSSS